MFESMYVREKDDSIVLGVNRFMRIYVGFGMIIVGALNLGFLTLPEATLFYGLMGGGFLLSGLYFLLISYSVTVDRVTSKVNIKRLSFVKEIPFSDIYYFEFRKFDFEDVIWNIYIIPLKGEPIKIYELSGYLKVERIAEKISNLTNKKCSFV